MSVRTRFLVVGGLVLAMAGITDANSVVSAGVTDTTEPAAASGDPIVVGIAAGFTGILEGFDVPAATGAQMAVDELNAAGGILGRPVEVVTADTRSDINQGARAGQEVIEQGADIMLVTPDFNFGGGAAREAQTAGMVVMSMGAGSPKFGIEGIGDLAFTIGISGVTDGAVSAEWAYQEMGHRTAYILIDDTTDYDKDQCRGFQVRWEELGGEILGSDTFKNSDASIAPQVSEIVAAGTEPDVISLCSYTPGGAVAIKQIRDAGIGSAIVNNGAMDGSYWFEDTMPDLSDVYIITSASIHGNDPSDEVNDFVARYTEQVGEPPPNVFGFFGYAAMKALAVAIEAAGTTDGQAVATALEGFDKEPIAGIDVTFSDTLHIDPARTERILGIQGGEFEVAASWAVQESPPLFE